MSWRFLYRIACTLHTFTAFIDSRSFRCRIVVVCHRQYRQLYLCVTCAPHSNIQTVHLASFKHHTEAHGLVQINHYSRESLQTLEMKEMQFAIVSRSLLNKRCYIIWMSYSIHIQVRRERPLTYSLNWNNSSLIQ